MSRISNSLSVLNFSRSFANRMPITLFILSSITGNLEWAVSITKGINFPDGFWMSITSICERGIIISRTCISETLRTPSSIINESASSIFLSKADFSISASCPLSPGLSRNFLIFFISCIFLLFILFKTLGKGLLFLIFLKFSFL